MHLKKKMTSFIVIAKNQNARKEYVKNFCGEQGIDPFDLTIIAKDTAFKKNLQSIGIEEIKNVQKKIFLKPIKSNTKAVIIEDAHLLTTEAQNALLKVLEEPPEHTILILAAETKEALLPTIISRCTVITLEKETVELSEEERTELLAFVHNLPTAPIGETLKKAEQLAKDKNQGAIWIEKLLLALREELLKSEQPDPSIFLLIQSLQKLHTTLRTTNINPRFAIEHTLLNSVL